MTVCFQIVFENLNMVHNNLNTEIDQSENNDDNTKEMNIPVLKYDNGNGIITNKPRNMLKWLSLFSY